MGMRWPHTTFTSGASRSFDETAFFMWELHVLGQTIADTEYVVPSKTLAIGRPESSSRIRTEIWSNTHRIHVCYIW